MANGNDKITVDVAGGCPKCGNPAMMVPEDYTDDTPVSCPKCGYKARYKDVYGEAEGSG
jgi:DNA-directed RNA polymerase subunit RPC12/RpoP